MLCPKVAMIEWCISTGTSFLPLNFPVLSSFSPSRNFPTQDSRLRLVYRSDRASGYRPVLRARLLDQTIPRGLSEIHFIVDVAGLREAKRLEPEPGLTELFHWNKTDGYNRTVYGLVNAKG